MTLEPTCGRCRFFESHPTLQWGDGMCLRHPPTVVEMGEEWAGVFPPVERQWWCGEFQPTEEPQS